MKTAGQRDRKIKKKMTQQTTQSIESAMIIGNEHPSVQNYRRARAQNITINSKRRATLPSFSAKMTKYIRLSLLLSGLGASAFTAPSHQRTLRANVVQNTNVQFQRAKYQSSTSLNVWWFGGTPGTASETSTSGEECELVAVRIDRTSPNSRRIAGEIIVSASPMDVWAILTDYDELSVHVPNLVASRRISDEGGQAGDGSHKCRLYQRGAQKIIGFEFGADVTMDMRESIVVAGKTGKSTTSHDTDPNAVSLTGLFPEERRIDFKCVDSQFFSEFDGTWRVVPMPDNPFTGEPETTVSYTVDVRPKGPVPVAALEWR